MEMHAPKAVFLSYASQDAEAARRIADALRTEGIEVWFDESHLRGGEAWDATIRKRISECALFVAIISANTQARREGYFRLEWRLAAQRTYMMSEQIAFLLPVVVDATSDADADVPGEFKAVQWTWLPGVETATAFVTHVNCLLTEPNVRVLPVSRGRTQPVAAPEVGTAAAPVPGDKSVAVLPFENRSDDKADAFFADGVHEDIITSLANIRELRVVSRTSVMRFRDTTRPMTEIGRELSVAHILEGSVRRAGNRVRITGQLIRVATDEHLWAKNYDRDLTAKDIFDIQAAVATEIAKSLRAAFSPEERAIVERRPTENLAAYDAYLKARANRELKGSTRTALNECEEGLKAAVALDPNFAEAWGELGVVHAFQHFICYDRSSERLARADAAIGRAVRLAPASLEIIRLLGMYSYYGYLDLARACEQLEKVVELQPNNSEAHNELGGVQRDHGRWLESLGNLRKATVLDPGNSRYSRSLVVFLEGGRRWNEALAEARRAVARWPDWIGKQTNLVWLSYWATGSTKEGDDWLHRLTPADFDSPEIIDFRGAWAIVKDDYAEWMRLGGASFGEGSPRNWSRVIKAATVIAAQGDLKAARVLVGAAPKELRSELEREPDNYQLLSDLAFMEALLGQDEEALRHASRAADLMPENRNAVLGPMFSHFMARVHAWIGEKDRAIDQLTRLLRIPFGSLGIHYVRTDPAWAPLRGDPRFKALLNDPKNNAPLF